ncbi:uncharacterized protein NFIA_007340 [Aspergillus fischeri NRRL 181]|uniref:Uncharacterized protein n=1 Tax=Neosartorya fischeri (strain ATCC 1020 / DSM 3700 / CBS 544.65 / FGSC A1164 / JCM 1740 / NRRL 181 / WB 181) TaxID=331117 RepID=A1D0X5_NEOFI|nr:uncharacterized protein NFIA_007340 [Aspergillus fischeri NRRL 181]EAW22068.1 hypothetical protein NFIA_007340 [Aspergillus fischeri NRRL 181]
MPGTRSNQSGNRNAAPAEGAEIASDSEPTPASGRTEPAAEETVPENQAAELPTDDVKLDGIPILNGDDELDDWLTYVQLTLDLYDLSRLIDPTIPRPKPKDPNYARWRRLSKQIRKWLILNISTNMLRSV